MPVSELSMIWLVLTRSMIVSSLSLTAGGCRASQAADDLVHTRIHDIDDPSCRLITALVLEHFGQFFIQVDAGYRLLLVLDLRDDALLGVRLVLITLGIGADLRDAGVIVVGQAESVDYLGRTQGGEGGSVISIPRRKGIGRGGRGGGGDRIQVTGDGGADGDRGGVVACKEVAPRLAIQPDAEAMLRIHRSDELGSQ